MQIVVRRLSVTKIRCETIWPRGFCLHTPIGDFGCGEPVWIQPAKDTLVLQYSQQTCRQNILFKTKGRIRRIGIRKKYSDPNPEPEQAVQNV